MSHELLSGLRAVDVLRAILTDDSHPVVGLDQLNFAGLVSLAILLSGFDPASQMGFFGAEVSPAGVAVHVSTSAVKRW